MMMSSPVEQSHDVNILREFSGAQQGPDHHQLLGRFDHAWVSLDDAERL